MKIGGGWCYNSGSSIDIDLNGNIYAIAYCEGIANFDTVLHNGYQYTESTALLKYDTDGNITWGRRFGSNEGMQSGGTCVQYLNGFVYCISNSWAGENVHVFDTILDYDCQGGGKMAYMTKFDTLGNFIWAKKIAESYSASYVLHQLISIDDDFYAIMIGDKITRVDTIDFLSPLSKYKSMITKIDLEGNVKWTKDFSNSDYENIIMSIDVDKDKNIIATGIYYDTLSVDGITLIDSSSTRSNSFLCKMDTSGNLIWIKDIHGWGDFNNIAVAVSENNIYTTGYYYGYMQADNVNLYSPQSYNMSILEFDLSGNVINGESFGANDRYIGSNAIVVDSKGYLVVAGQYMDHAILENYTLFADSLLPPGDAPDSFIFKYQPKTFDNISVFNIDSSDIRLYPNPNNGKFYISSKNKFINCSVVIQNSIGNVVYQNKIQNQQVEEIDMINRPSGLYMITISDGDFRFSKKFIVL